MQAMTNHEDALIARLATLERVAAVVNELLPGLPDDEAYRLLAEAVSRIQSQIGRDIEAVQRRRATDGAPIS
jgi:hypothetical protein